MKVAIVTGGNRGLGRSTAEHLAKAKVGIIFTYRTHKAEADEVTSEIRKLGGQAVALQLDVSKTETFGKFAADVKGALKSNFDRTDFDFLVNNAGIGIQAPFVKTTEEQFDELMKVHLKGPFFLTQRLLPLMKEGGRIVNFSSGTTRAIVPGTSAYAMMKGGIEVLTRYLAKELGEKKIAVNAVAPGAMETDFGGGFIRDNREINTAVASQTALGRVGVPDDVGGAVNMLLSDESHWITAQRIEVSGGMNI